MRADHDVEVLVGHLPQHLVTQHAGVGDHHVEAAELVDGALHQRVRRLGITDRAHLRDGAAPLGCDRVGRRLGGVAVHIVDHHGRAGASTTRA